MHTHNSPAMAEAHALLVRLSAVLQPEQADFGEISISTNGTAGAMILLKTIRSRHTMHRAVDIGTQGVAKDTLHDLLNRIPVAPGCAFRVLAGGGSSVYWRLRLQPQSAHALSAHLGFGKYSSCIAKFFDSLWGGTTSFAYECGPSGNRLRFYNVIASETDLERVLACQSKFWPTSLAWPRPRDLWLACAPKREVMVNLSVSKNTLSLKLDFPQVPLAFVSTLGRSCADADDAVIAAKRLLRHSSRTRLSYFGVRWCLTVGKCSMTAPPEFSYYVQMIPARATNHADTTGQKHTFTPKPS